MNFPAANEVDLPGPGNLEFKGYIPLSVVILRLPMVFTTSSSPQGSNSNVSDFLNHP